MDRPGQRKGLNRARGEIFDKAETHSTSESF